MKYPGRILFVAAALVLGGLWWLGRSPATPVPEQGLPVITVYKSPTCGCCTKWISHLEANGFRVETRTVHLSTSTLLGVGWSGSDRDDYTYGGHGHYWSNGQTFFVAEPGVGLTLNVAPFLRLGLDASYRFAGASLSRELRGVRLSGPAEGLRLQIGRHL